MTMQNIYENEEWMVELRDDGLHLITAKRRGGYYCMPSYDFNEINKNFKPIRHVMRKTWANRETFEDVLNWCVNNGVITPNYKISDEFDAAVLDG